MYNYDKIRFSMDRDGMVSLKMEKDHNVWEDKDGNVIENKSNVWLGGCLKSRARYVWFFFSRRDWYEFVNDSFRGVFCDCSHRLDVFGDACMFYDIDAHYVLKSHGEMTVKFQSFSFPVYVRKIVARLLRLAASRHDFTSEDRVSLDISRERLAKLCRRYGQGTGKVDLVMNDETKEKLTSDHTKDPKLFENVWYLANGCLNSTKKFNETAKLCIDKDRGSYYFRQVSVNGKTMMNGGIVNHGSEDKPEWSVHT